MRKVLHKENWVRKSRKQKAQVYVWHRETEHVWKPWISAWASRLLEFQFKFHNRNENMQCYSYKLKFKSTYLKTALKLHRNLKLPFSEHLVWQMHRVCTPPPWCSLSMSYVISCGFLWLNYCSRTLASPAMFDPLFTKVKALGFLNLERLELLWQFWNICNDVQPQVVEKREDDDPQ